MSTGFWGYWFTRRFGEYSTTMAHWFDPGSEKTACGVNASLRTGHEVIQDKPGKHDKCSRCKALKAKRDASNDVQTAS